MSNIKEEIIDILSNHLDYDKNKIKLDSNIVDDLGADSWDGIEIIMSIEEKYNISINDSDFINIKTVEQLIEKVKENI